VCVFVMLLDSEEQDMIVTGPSPHEGTSVFLSVAFGPRKIIIFFLYKSLWSASGLDRNRKEHT